MGTIEKYPCENSHCEDFRCENSFCLSDAAKNELKEMQKYRDEEYLPQSWDKTFLNLAREIAKRSPDSETQVGAVIVDKSNHVRGIGYNGWMKGIDDHLIPNKRPLKHDWVIHSELNAILNCEHRPDGCSIYCTHKPCLNCFFAIVNAGITEIYYPKEQHSTTNISGKERLAEIAEFLVKNRVNIYEI